MALANNINDVEITPVTYSKTVTTAEPDTTLSSPIINKNQDLQYLYNQAPIGIVLNIIAALLVCWFVMSEAPDYMYVPWLAFIVLTSFTHTLLIKEFNRNRNTLHVDNQWAIYHTFMMGLNALAFSVGYLMFLPLLDSFSQTVLMLILATMAVSFLPILSIFLPAYIIYISAFIFPTVFWIYTLPTDIGYPVAGLLTVTYCMLVIVASYYSKALLEAFSLASEVNNQANQLKTLLDEKNTANVKLKRDMYELGKFTDKACQQREQAEITLQAISEGVITTDAYGKICYINPVAEVYTGYEANQVNGNYISMVTKLVDESSLIKLPDPVEYCLETKAPVHSTDSVMLVRKDGLQYAVDYSVTPILAENNNIKGAVMVFRDITEKRKMEKDLSWRDKHDSLTGLINRDEFYSRLRKILSSKEQSKNEHALCLIDLDRFLLINDSCGREAGDALLNKVANRLKKLTRDTDTLARLGNDEFAVVMYSCTTDKAKLIADIFREEIHKINFEWEDKYFSISASIGIVAFSSDSYEDMTVLQRHAEITCNRAKKSGGNKIELFKPENTEYRVFTGQLKLLEDLQHNIEKENFALVTQRIQPLDDLNETIIQEVLLRMHNANNELTPANNFIHTAETYHLLSAIDQWVIKLVMEMIAYGNPVFKHADVTSINISRQSVLNEKLVDYINKLLKDYDINASSICFEINEPQFRGNISALKRFVTLVKQLGCKVALDEFNYNPEIVNVVRQLNIDYVKLDARQFKNVADETDFDYALLESINNINHMVGAQTVIKCLDDEKSLESLYEIGTDYVQGYAVEAPQPLTNTKVA